VTWTVNQVSLKTFAPVVAFSVIRSKAHGLAPRPDKSVCDKRMIRLCPPARWRFDFDEKGSRDVTTEVVTTELRSSYEGRPRFGKWIEDEIIRSFGHSDAEWR
jgi:hypothetical protein